MSPTGESCRRLCLAFLLIPLATGSRSGDLDPPGAPAPTVNPAEPRTPISELPFVISAPGSYYLTDSLTGIPASPGISVEVDNVTIDLRGFALIGVPGSRAGIDAPSLQSGLTVRNGIIRGWGEDGLNAGNVTACLIERVQAIGNGTLPGHAGLHTSSNSAVRECVSVNNGGPGISVNDNSTVAGCTAADNGAQGIRGLQASVVTSCNAQGNTLAGIQVGNNSTVHASTASGNGIAGISTGVASVVLGCSATLNASDGIDVGFRSTVSDCTSSYNDDDGIEMSDFCLITGNVCSGNDADNSDVGAGIHCDDNNRIDGNHITYNHVGLALDFSGNLAIRNSLKGNDIRITGAAGDLVAAFLTSQVELDANTNPFANFDIP
jgi:hypothetical protein